MKSIQENCIRELDNSQNGWKTPDIYYEIACHLLHTFYLIVNKNKQNNKANTHTHVLDAIMFGDKKPGINK